VSSLRMSLFYRFKLLRQLSMLLNIQYRMIDVIESMISKLFYANQISNDEEIVVVNRLLSQAIINYFSKFYSISTSIMLLQVEEKTLKDSTHSLYNLINASTILNMIIKMIEQKIVQSCEVFIITFYRAQYRLYRQTLRNLFLRDSTMLDV
jgi:superfamily I DNA and/or RNA helicase